MRLLLCQPAGASDILFSPSPCFARERWWLQTMSYTQVSAAAAPSHPRALSVMQAKPATVARPWGNCSHTRAAPTAPPDTPSQHAPPAQALRTFSSGSTPPAGCTRPSCTTLRSSTSRCGTRTGSSRRRTQCRTRSAWWPEGRRRARRWRREAACEHVIRGDGATSCGLTSEILAAGSCLWHGFSLVLRCKGASVGSGGCGGGKCKAAALLRAEQRRMRDAAGCGNDPDGAGAAWRRRGVYLAYLREAVVLMLREVKTPPPADRRQFDTAHLL